MAELEEKLNAILGDQEAMGKIMALARSLSGRQEPPAPDECPAGGEPEPAGEGGAPLPEDLSALLGQADPALIRAALAALRQFQAGEDRSAALLRALRPFVREDRRGRLDRAVELTRTARLLRAVLGAVGKGAREGV